MGFLNPVNLTCLASIGVLLAIYLIAGQYPKLIVPSLLLFEDVTSVASKRRFHSDIFFWLEALILTTLAFCAAELYLKVRTRPPSTNYRVFIFDIGAAMGARETHGSRLELAKQEALKLIAQSRPGTEFAVTTYALEARVVLARTSDVASVKKAINGLRPQAVASRVAALTAALASARQADDIDVFSDRLIVPKATVAQSVTGSFHFHGVGSLKPNLALVALEPGKPKETPGYCVVHNYSADLARAEVIVSLQGQVVSRQVVVLPANGQVVVPFGPIGEGGLLRAEVVGNDALEFDNARYAYVPPSKGQRVLILSGDSEVNEDVEKLVKAVAPQAQVDSVNLKQSAANLDQSLSHLTGGYDLVIVHDEPAAEALRSQALLAFFPRAGGPIKSATTVAQAELDRIVGAQRLLSPISLGQTRLLWLPDWMQVLAVGASWQPARLIPLAAEGRFGEKRFGIIAFDIRDHLLFDPDHLPALELVVRLLTHLLRPASLMVVSTGSDISLKANQKVMVMTPDGRTGEIEPGKDGLVHIVPVEVGRYQVKSNGFSQTILANYFDAFESNLQVHNQSFDLPPHSDTRHKAQSRPFRPHPLTVLLASLALGVFLLESALLIAKRRKIAFGRRYV